MLRSISWLQFISFLFIGFLLYYGYFAVVLFRAGMLGAILSGRERPSGGTAPAASDMGEDRRGLAGDGGEEAKRLETDKNVLGPQKQGVAAGNNVDINGKNKGDGNAAAKATMQIKEMALTHLQEVVDDAINSGQSWEGIKGRIRLVLSGCRDLLGTEHEKSVNVFIERSCRSSFALMLGEDDLKGLWHEEEEKKGKEGSTDKTKMS